jgi:hypothetical protein
MGLLVVFRIQFASVDYSVDSDAKLESVRQTVDLTRGRRTSEGR